MTHSRYDPATPHRATPDPVLDFFARFLANPDYKGLCDFCFTLLGLELARAEGYVGPDGPPFELSDGYRSDVVTAQRSLAQASDGDSHLDLAFHWLVLLGHRLGTERGLATGGTAAPAAEGDGTLVRRDVLPAVHGNRLAR